MIDMVFYVFLTLCFFWFSLGCFIAAYRYRERALIILGASVLFMGISLSIPLTGFIEGFGFRREGLFVQTGAFVLGALGMLIFQTVFGGWPGLLNKSISLKQIVLLRGPK